MILRVFRSNQPALGFLYPFFAGLLWLPGWWVNQPPDQQMTLLQSPGLSSAWSDGIATAVAFTMVLAGAWLFNQLFQQFDLTERKNQLPGLCYVIAFSWSPFLLQFTFLLPGQIFLLLAVRRLMAVYRQPVVLRELFDAGIFTALAALCYLPFAFLLVACWLSIGLLRPFQWREWFMPVAAFFVIGTIYFSLAYLLNWQVSLNTDEMWQIPQRTVPLGLFAGFKYMLAAILLLMTAVSVPGFIGALQRSTMRNRNLKMILVIFGGALAALYLLMLFWPGLGSNVYLLAFPVALMLVYAVADKKPGRIITLLFYLLLVSALVNNYGIWFNSPH